jgi:hypothetical protein
MFAPAIFPEYRTAPRSFAIIVRAVRGTVPPAP